MFRKTFVIAAILFGMSLANGVAYAAEKPEAKPILAALDQLRDAIVAGDLKKAQAAFAGEKKDLDLLQAYIDAVAVDKQLHTAVDAKFGVDAKRAPFGFAFRVQGMVLRDPSLMFINGDTASAGIGTPVSVGIEFKKVGQQWKVSSLASMISTPEKQIGQIKAFIAATNAVTADLNKGVFKSADQVVAAEEDASHTLYGSPSTRPAGKPVQ